MPTFTIYFFICLNSHLKRFSRFNSDRGEENVSLNIWMDDFGLTIPVCLDVVKATVSYVICSTCWIHRYCFHTCAGGSRFGLKFCVRAM